MEKLYRIIGKEEIVEIQSDSNTTLSPRKQRVIDLLPQIFDVCSLAAKCNIKIASALRIATQYGWVKNQIQECSFELSLLARQHKAGVVTATTCQSCARPRNLPNRE